jgi:hypothetical protein
MNGLVAVLLALATAGIGLLYIGSQEEHTELIERYLWQTLLLRFSIANCLGLMAAGLWWAVIRMLFTKKRGTSVSFRKTAWLLIASSCVGSLVGAVCFCFC